MVDDAEYDDDDDDDVINSWKDGMLWDVSEWKVDFVGY